MTTIYKDAVEKWGVAFQITIAMEEMGECIASLNQYFFRSRIPIEKLAEEIADVEIVCEQLRVIVGNDIVEKVKAKKLKRFTKRVLEKSGKP